MKYFFLILITAYGVFVAWHASFPVPPQRLSSYASASFNTLVFYLGCVTAYLAVNRGKETKFLLIYSLVVIGFIAKLMSSLNQ